MHSQHRTSSWSLPCRPSWRQIPVQSSAPGSSHRRAYALAAGRTALVAVYNTLCNPHQKQISQQSTSINISAYISISLQHIIMERTRSVLPWLHVPFPGILLPAPVQYQYCGDTLHTLPTRLVRCEKYVVRSWKEIAYGVYAPLALSLNQLVICDIRERWARFSLILLLVLGSGD